MKSAILSFRSTDTEEVKTPKACYDSEEDEEDSYDFNLLNHGQQKHQGSGKQRNQIPFDGIVHADSRDKTPSYEM